MEKEKVIFKTLLQLLSIKNVNKVFKKKQLNEDLDEVDLDEEVKEEITLLVVQSKFCT